MSTRFTLTDSDYNVKTDIAIDGGDMTVTLAIPNDAFVVEVGDSLWTATEFRQRITRALEQMRDALREAQWPDGPLASSFATMAGIETPKGQIVVGNAAVAPIGSESGLRIGYNTPISGAGADSGGTSAPGAGGSGSSVNRNATLDRIIEFIRETLVTTAVAPP